MGRDFVSSFPHRAGGSGFQASWRVVAVLAWLALSALAAQASVEFGETDFGNSSRLTSLEDVASGREVSGVSRALLRDKGSRPRRGRRSNSSSSTDTPRSADHRLFYTVDDLGAFIGRLPGRLLVESTPYPAEQVTVHFYLRSFVINDVEAQVGGVYFIESTDRAHVNRQQNSRHIAMPPVASVWAPTIFLRNPETNERWTFEVELWVSGTYTENGEEVPFSCAPQNIKTVVPLASVSNVSLELGMEGFQRVLSYPFNEYHSATPGALAENITNPQVWILQKIPFGWDAPTFIDQIIFQTMYHIPLGFSGSIQYVDLDNLAALLVDSRILQMINDGQLRLVLWHKMTACEEHDLCYVHNVTQAKYTQSLQYSHAMIAFRGQNTLLALVDQDEYLALNDTIKTVQEAYHKCWVSRLQIALERYHMGPYVNYTKGVEWPRWWVPKAYKVHPLENYGVTWFNPDFYEQGKVIANPNRIGGCYIHSCTQPKDRPMFSYVWHHLHPDSEDLCGYWLHVTNQHENRLHIGEGRFSEYYVSNASKWRWVLDDLKGLMPPKRPSVPAVVSSARLQ